MAAGTMYLPAGGRHGCGCFACDGWRAQTQSHRLSSRARVWNRPSPCPCARARCHPSCIPSPASSIIFSTPFPSLSLSHLPSLKDWILYRTIGKQIERGREGGRKNEQHLLSKTWFLRTPWAVELSPRNPLLVWRDSYREIVLDYFPPSFAQRFRELLLCTLFFIFVFVLLGFSFAPFFFTCGEVKSRGSHGEARALPSLRCHKWAHVLQ